MLRQVYDKLVENPLLNGTISLIAFGTYQLTTGTFSPEPSLYPDTTFIDRLHEGLKIIFPLTLGIAGFTATYTLTELLKRTTTSTAIRDRIRFSQRNKKRKLRNIPVLTLRDLLTFNYKNTFPETAHAPLRHATQLMQAGQLEQAFALYARGAHHLLNTKYNTLTLILANPLTHVQHTAHQKDHYGSANIALAIANAAYTQGDRAFTLLHETLTHANPLYPCLAAYILSQLPDIDYDRFVKEDVPHHLFSAFSRLPPHCLESTITSEDTGNVTAKFTDEHPLLQTLFFIKMNASPAPLHEEHDNNTRINTIIKDIPYAFTPTPIGVTHQPVTLSGTTSHIFVQASEEATQLLTLIDEKKTTYLHFERITTALATLHALFPPLPHITPVPLPRKLTTKLDTLALPPELRARIQESIAPLLTQLTALPHVFNKDGHPENYLITPYDDIIIVDNENRGFIPYPIDIVNLTEHPTLSGEEYLTPEEKHTLDAHYHAVFSSLRPDTTYYDEAYTTARTHALLFRGLSNIATWSDKRRQRMRPRRQTMARKLQKAIEQLEQDCPDCFKENEQAYATLHQTLDSLLPLIS